jgi:hypothetical protein
MKTIKLNFDSIHDFYTLWYSRKGLKDKDRFDLDMEITHDETFKRFAGATAEYIEEHKYGDDAIVAQAQNLPAFRQLVNNAKKVPIFSDDGDDMDMERFIEGNEFCFIKRIKKTGINARGIKQIYINLGESADKNARDMLYKTYAAVKLCDALENQGHRTEIIVYTCSKKFNKTDTCEISITIKAANEPLNLSLIAFATSPLFFRFYLIPAICYCGENVREGHGSAENIDDLPPEAYHIKKGKCLGEYAATNWLNDNEHTHPER